MEAGGGGGLFSRQVAAAGWKKQVSFKERKVDKSSVNHSRCPRIYFENLTPGKSSILGQRPFECTYASIHFGPGLNCETLNEH